MFEFRLPDLGEGVAEGQIASVLVKEGDTIAEFQPMLEVETDKAAVEIPAPTAGVVAKLHVSPGQTVKVGTVLITIDESAAGGAAKAAPATATKTAAAPAAAKTTPASGGTAAPAAAARPAATPTRSEAPPARPAGAPPAAPADDDAATAAGPVAAAPAVRKLAREMGVDLAKVSATGPHGRVLREDVERAARGPTPAAAGPSGFVPAPAELPDFSQWGPVRREPAPQIRKTIARQMAIAWQSVPRVTHTDTADITDLDRIRIEYNAGLRPDDTKLTVTAVVLKAVALTLRQHPRVNCSYDAPNGEIIFKDYVNIGIAVDTPRGLIVPVLRDADHKPLPAIARELVGLAERVRGGKFDLAELRGATFTVTNIGPLGGRFITPMVNFPEVAILGLGRAGQEAVVRGGQIVPRLILPLSLSYDHRIVDGGDGARFCTDIVRALENPLRLLALA